MRKLWIFAVTTLGAATLNAQTTLPGVTVTGSPLKEEAVVGPYEQPEWTQERRFPTTRVYLQQPPWGIGVEQWVRSKFYDGDRGKHRIQEEVEIGLPYRFQIDIYDNWERTESGTLYHDNVAGEVRYALADWGKIPLNPTVYAEFKLKDEGANVAEYKLLLGEELGAGWHWGANAAYEYDLGGEKAKEYAASMAVSKAIIDSKLSVGIECLFASESTAETRDEPENSLNIGPSIQWRPTKQSHLDLVAMPGFTEDAPDWLTFFVLGYNFGDRAEGGMAPISTKSK